MGVQVAENILLGGTQRVSAETLRTENANEEGWGEPA